MIKLKKFALKLRKRDWAIVAAIAVTVLMLIAATGEPVTGPIFGAAISVVGLFCLAYWLGFVVRVIGYFGEHNENAWPKWVGLWATINIMWVALCYMTAPNAPLALNIFIGPIVGLVMFVVAAIDLGIEGGLPAAYNDLAPLLPTLMFWATIAGLIKAISKDRIRQDVACAVLIVITSLTLTPHALGLLS